MNYPLRCTAAFAAGLVFFGSALAQPATRPATRPTTAPATAPAMDDTMQGGSDDAMTGATMEETMRARAARERAAPTSRADRSAFLRRASRPEGAAVGTSIPGDLSVHDLNGRPRQLSTLLGKHRPTVIVLGSLSSPSFRDRLLDIPWLLRRLDGNGELLIIYTREQHPDGTEWQVPRNEADEVRIPAHDSLEERLELALRVRNAEGMRGRKVYADSMDDTLLKAIAGEESIDRPANYAIVVAPDGTVLARQDWFDPSGIPPLLKDLNP